MGKTIASTSWDRTVRLWDTETGKSVHVLKGHTAGGVISAVFSPDGKNNLPVQVFGDNTIRFWDVNSGDIQRTLKGHILTGDIGNFRSN